MTFTSLGLLDGDVGDVDGLGGDLVGGRRLSPARPLAPDDHQVFVDLTVAVVGGNGIARGPRSHVAVVAGTTPTAAAPLGHGALAVGQQGQFAGRLDGHGHIALVLGTVARDPAGPDLAAVGHEAPQQVDVLVVDPLDVVAAEDADRLLGVAPPGVLGGPAPVAALASSTGP